jgi:hypothetical protein
MLEEIPTLLNVKALVLKIIAYEACPEDGSYKVMVEMQVLDVFKCGRLALHTNRN